MKKLIFILLLVSPAFISQADEGMWLLTRLKQYNESHMKALGLKIPVEYIVDSLSQAIISYNGNGTASFISENGLVATNYHCAYDAIQQNSTSEHNYIRDGFWAQSHQEEIPLKGVSLTINRVIRDISEEVNAKLPTEGASYQSAFKAINDIAEKYRKQYPGLKVTIRSYRNNTLHILYVTQAFQDVRLVAAPPYAIAKFGGETDNWMWPRHGCDFALLRVYVAPDGTSLGYDKNNMPFHPDVHLKVSTDGYKKGDYAMSIGYPGFTERNATSMQIWERRNVLNPPLMTVRTARQEILQKYMNADESLHIKYAAKYAASANYCKNTIGVNQWIDSLHLIDKKHSQEQEFLKNCASDSLRKYYAATLECVEKEIKAGARYRLALGYYTEVFGEGCEMLNFISVFGKAIPSVLKVQGENLRNFVTNVKLYYKDYSEEVDRAVTKELLKVISQNLESDLLPEFLINLPDEKSIEAFVDKLYTESAFANEQKLLGALQNPEWDVEKDIAYQIGKQIGQKRQTLFSFSGKKMDLANQAKARYTRGVINANESDFYPDADKSIRLSYGSVQDLPLGDGTIKPFQTTLSGVIAKASDTNPDFYLPEKLKRLWENKDFGPYAENGDLPTDFITNGDVTGGNSGSPLLNARGEVIGLVFDCNWESMTRDFNFDQDLHRVICLDIRYVLFILQKYAGLNYIVDEILK